MAVTSAPRICLKLDSVELYLLTPLMRGENLSNKQESLLKAAMFAIVLKGGRGGFWPRGQINKVTL